MSNTFKKIDSKDINRFEMNLGFSLPEVYKKFLLKTNGGRISPDNFKTVNKEIESQIQFMFGIVDKSIYDLKSNYYLWKSNNGQENLIPIAIDSLGNLILLSCSVPTKESIYLCIHDLDSQLFLIATNFSDFLKGLYNVDISWSELELAVLRQDFSYFDNRVISGDSIDLIRNDYNQPATVIAALYNKVELLKYFRRNGSKLSGALFNAASNGCLEAVIYLLSLGIDPDERDHENNYDTGLMLAAFGGHQSVVEELVRGGADVNAKDLHGQSVLTKAKIAREGYLNFLGLIRIERFIVAQGQ